MKEADIELTSCTSTEAAREPTVATWDSGPRARHVARLPAVLRSPVMITGSHGDSRAVERNLAPRTFAAFGGGFRAAPVEEKSHR